MPLADDVSALLDASKNAHYMARDARRAKDSQAEQDELTVARATRLEAHSLDPGHGVGAWDDAMATQKNGASKSHEELHTQLLDFYAERIKP